VANFIILFRKMAPKKKNPSKSCSFLFFSFSEIKKLTQVAKVSPKKTSYVIFKCTNQFVLPFFPLFFYFNKKRPNLLCF
jgi:hypothetical protein